jgi:hypothetical protein
MKPALQPTDFLDDAVSLGCEPRDIQVVANVESRGYGFDPEDYPKTLFEGQWFHKFTGGKYDQIAPSLSYPVWTKAYYRDWKGEKQRLAQAVALDREAALKSASWGTFQIMGFNFKDAGCTDIEQFVNMMNGQSNDHLTMFTSLMLSWGLNADLKIHDWASVARRYNGTGQVADYSSRMRTEYARLGGR